MKTCPNCGFQCEPTDTECLKCGIVFQKWTAIEASKKALEEKKRAKYEEWRINAKWLVDGKKRDIGRKRDIERERLDKEAERIKEQDAEIFAELEEERTRPLARDAKIVKTKGTLRKLKSSFDLQKVWHYFRKRPRLYVPSAIIVTALFGLYLWGPVGLISSENGAQRLEKNFAEWKSMARIAEVTPRIGLVNIVPNLQAIKEKTKLTEVPLCLKNVRDYLVQGMEASIKSYVSFMRHDEYDTTATKTYALISEANFLIFNIHLSLVKEGFFKRIRVLFKSEAPIVAEKES
jgi:hypothetical protein